MQGNTATQIIDEPAQRRQFREAREADIPDIVRLGMSGLENEAYDENLVVDRTKVYDVAKQCVVSPHNLALVGTLDGQVVSALCVITHDMTFHRRKQASIVQFYTEAPGMGVPLIRRALEWTELRPMVKMVVFTLEHNADPRIGKLLTRLGLREIHPVYVRTT